MQKSIRQKGKDNEKAAETKPQAEKAQESSKRASNLLPNIARNMMPVEKRSDSLKQKHGLREKSESN